jgi:dipeptidyl aminopeptidase/acylaminoacyl peptidase/sugar lactone lactonase YvrE
MHPAFALILCLGQLDLSAPGVEKVATGFSFSEGPAADKDGNVYFTDSPKNRIHVYRPSTGKTEIAHEKTTDANGMRFDAQGRLVVACGEDGARAVIRYEKDGTRTTLADKHAGKRLTAPNDLCFDKTGRIYFTDPCYGRKPKDGQEIYAVYRIDAKEGQPVPNEVTRVVSDVEMPNGIVLSPDEKTLYVADASPNKKGPHLLLAYDVAADGKCSGRRVVYDFKEDRGIDGMTIDSDGNIVATAGNGKTSGVYVIAPTGKQLGFVPLPETATNCIFADKTTLYATAGHSLYRIRFVAKGAKAAGWAKDLVDVRDIRSLTMSPDGKTIACIVATPDYDANTTHTAAWLVPFDKGEPTKLDLDVDGVSRLLWAPKGTQIGIEGSKGKSHFLGIYDVAEKKLRRLVDIHRGNAYLAHAGASWCWAPDAKALAYLAADTGAKPAPTEPRVIDRIQYKNRTGFADGRRSHIWIVDVDSAKPRQLTAGDHDEHSIDWSPKGDEIVFCANLEPDPDANCNNDLFVVDVKSGKITQVTKTPGNEMSPVWSPDGTKIAYLATKRPLTTIDSVAEDDHVWVLDRTDRKHLDLTSALDRRCFPPRWAADGKAVYFLARDRGLKRLCKTALAAETIGPPFLQQSVHEFGEVRQFSIFGDLVPMVVSGPEATPRIWVRKPAINESPYPGVHVIATEFAPPGVVLGGRKTNIPEEVEFKSFDGTPILGSLYLPPGASAATKCPLILDIHGGPHSMWEKKFQPTHQMMVAHGYAVLALDPRGSSGYGQKFADGCVNDWGGGDYKDLMAGVDHVLAKYPQIDGGRMGVMGGSYGGYMTNWIITHTDRFKAAVSYAGLSNLVSFYATSLYQDLIHVEFGGPPWEKHDILWEKSPLKHIKNAKTPTLIIHGEADNDVHITQSEELFTALKYRGVETVFVRYPRQGHGASEPRQQVDILERELDWFDRHLRK